MPRFLLPLIVAVLVAGCGGDGESGPAEPDQPSSAESAGDENIGVAALGDSITAGSPLYDPNLEARTQLGFGDDERSQFSYWANEAEPGLEFENCGVFGERTDEIALRLNGCADGADLLLVQGGINDIAQSLANGPDAALEAASAAAANIDGMISQGEKLGLEVVVVNVLPWNNGHPVADDPINRLNSEIADIAERRGVPLVDFHGALEDPDMAGVMAAEYTDDGDHPSIEGYRILGELVAKELG